MRKELEAEAYKEINESDVPRISGSLSEAIKTVYEQYGNNLPAFFRDAYEEAAAARRNEEPDSGEVEAATL